MTVGSVPPSLALGTVATTQPGVPVALSNGAGTSTAGLAQGNAAQAAAPQTTPSNPLPQAASALDALALNAAAQAALGKGGLALLMADLSQALRIPSLPAPVQAAISQILSLRTPLSAPPTAADLKAALTLSSPPTTPSASIAASPDAALAANALASGGPLKSALLGLQQVLSNWLATAPAPTAASAASAASAPNAPPQQNNPAPALANLAQALRASGLPVPVQSALLQALTPLATPAAAAAMPTEPGLVPVPSPSGTAGVVAPTVTVPAPTSPLANPQSSLPTAIDQASQPELGSAAANSPTPAEAALPASGAPATATNTVTAPIEDIGTVLSSLAPAAPAASSAALPAAENVSAPTTPPAANALAATVLATLPANVDLRAVMLVVQQVFKSWLDGGSTPLSSAPANVASAQQASAIAGGPRATPAPPPFSGNAPSPASAPPPPYRGGPTTAQPAVPSTLAATADPVTAGTRLLRETNAALAHRELLQIASLPANTQGLARSDSQNPQWMFEIPFATAQGSAIAQFKVTRDGGKGKGKGGKAPVWRANFSLDVEPMGPVHAQIVLSGDRTWVSLWAEREESVTRLRDHETLLTTSLKDSNFVAEVAFHAGAPRQPIMIGRHFLNRES